MLSFARSRMKALLNDLAIQLGLADDPRIVYSLAAAALLLLVSLATGWRRLDFVALLRPATLLRLCGAVAAAFLIVVATELTTTPGSTAEGLLLGTARLPLYLMALAYGPSAGLLVGVLFSAATATGTFPGWSEALLVLELTVAGWLAISPSPRSRRWAGPLNAVMAHALAVGTAGVAFAVWRVGEVDLALLMADQRAALPGLICAWALLLLFRPGFYERFLPRSRIAPGRPEPADERTARALPERAAREHLPTVTLPPLTRRPRPQGRELAEPALPHDDPNG